MQTKFSVAEMPGKHGGIGEVRGERHKTEFNGIILAVGAVSSEPFSAKFPV
jgi:hypothetical protein